MKKTELATLFRRYHIPYHYMENRNLKTGQKNGPKQPDCFIFTTRAFSNQRAPLTLVGPVVSIHSCRIQDFRSCIRVDFSLPRIRSMRYEVRAESEPVCIRIWRPNSGICRVSTEVPLQKVLLKGPRRVILTRALTQIGSQVRRRVKRR